MKLGYTILYVKDVPRSVAFYEDAFGLSRRFVHEAGMYAEMDTGATTLSFAANGLAKSNLPCGFQENDPANPPAGFEIAFTTDDVQTPPMTARSRREPPPSHRPPPNPGARSSPSSATRTASWWNSARPPPNRERTWQLLTRENDPVQFPPPCPGSDATAFFRESRWKNRFEDEILAAAQSLVSKVRDLKLEEPAADSFTLLGNVGKERRRGRILEIPRPELGVRNLLFLRARCLLPSRRRAPAAGGEGTRPFTPRRTQRGGRRRRSAAPSTRRRPATAGGASADLARARVRTPRHPRTGRPHVEAPAPVARPAGTRILDLRRGHRELRWTS